MLEPASISPIRVLYEDVKIAENNITRETRPLESKKPPILQYFMLDLAIFGSVTQIPLP
jgi:hypothetical protein